MAAADNWNIVHGEACVIHFLRGLFKSKKTEISWVTDINSLSTPPLLFEMDQSNVVLWRHTNT